MPRLPAVLLLLALVACTRGGGPGVAARPAQPVMGAAAAPPLSPAQARRIAELPPAFRHPDIANGQLHFVLCKPCHTAVQGGPDMTGPNLYGLFGRKAASRPGFAYSAALRAKAWTWDAAHLDIWLKSPRTAVPGTKMGFYGIPDDQDRRDLIAYLKLATSGDAPAASPELNPPSVHENDRRR